MAEDALDTERALADRLAEALRDYVYLDDGRVGPPDRFTVSARQALAEHERARKGDR